MLHVIKVLEPNYTSLFISMSIAFNTIVPVIVPNGHIGSFLGRITMPIVIKVDPLFLIRSVINSTFKLKKAILIAIMYTMVINQLYFSKANNLENQQCVSASKEKLANEKKTYPRAFYTTLQRQCRQMRTQPCLQDGICAYRAPLLKTFKLDQR